MDLVPTGARWGYAFRLLSKSDSASHGRDPLEAAARVLLSDIGMPSIDGFELVRRVRELFPDSDMLAMALTGLGGTNDRKRALAEGFQVCMVKPVEPDRLVEAIRQMLPSLQQSAHN